MKLFSEERCYLNIRMHYITQPRNGQGCIHQVLLQLLNSKACCLSAGRCSLLEQVWWDSSFPSPYRGKNYFIPRGFWEVSGVGVGITEHLAHTESFTKLHSFLTSLKSLSPLSHLSQPCPEVGVICCRPLHLSKSPKFPLGKGGPFF